MKKPQIRAMWARKAARGDRGLQMPNPRTAPLGVILVAGLPTAQASEAVLVDGPNPDLVFNHYYRGAAPVHDLRSLEGVPAEELDKEKEILRNKALNDGKPEKIVDRIVEGSIAKFYSENCLLEQSFVKDDSQTIGAMLTTLIAKIGEKISIRRFTRYEMGEGLQKREDDFAAEVMKQAGQ